MYNKHSLKKEGIIQHGLITSILRILVSSAFGEENDKIGEVVEKSTAPK